MPPAPAVRLLLVEDSDDDALLLEKTLRRESLDFEIERVVDENGLRAALRASLTAPLTAPLSAPLCAPSERSARRVARDDAETPVIR